MTEEVVEVPAVLGKRGGAFWSALQADFEFDSKELELLLEACRVLDVIDGLEAVVSADGITSKGSTGQTVVHPALVEIRNQQASFARLSGLLNLPEDVAAQDRFRHRRAVAGAEARHLRAVR